MSLFPSSHLLSRREWLASGTALLASACTHRKASGYPGYALVATSGENSVAAVDLNRFQLVKKIDLNAATKEELESLPGIGPVRAQAIIDGRPYAKPEDVMKVKGIKEGIYNEIKDQISVKP